MSDRSCAEILRRAIRKAMRQRAADWPLFQRRALPPPADPDPIREEFLHVLQQAAARESMRMVERDIEAATQALGKSMVGLVREHVRRAVERETGKPAPERE